MKPIAGGQRDNLQTLVNEMTHFETIHKSRKEKCTELKERQTLIYQTLRGEAKAGPGGRCVAVFTAENPSLSHLPPEETRITEQNETK